MVVQRAVADYAVKERGAWILIWPGMIVLCGSQMYWTSELEEAVDAAGVKGLAKYEAQCTKQLQELVQLVRAFVLYFIIKNPLYKICSSNFLALK